MPARPWNDGKYEPKKPKNIRSQQPLIPKNVLSVPSQRLLVVSTFLLIQCFKLISSKLLSNFLSYTALDAVILGFLPMMGIPRLNFRIKVVNFQIGLAVVINYLIFIDASLFWLALWLLLRPLSWLLGFGKNTKPRSGGLIQGKYVVDILPEASAKLDIISPLCLENSKPVYLRLSLENSWPAQVSLSRAELGNTENYEQLTYSKRQLSKLPKEKGLIYLPVKEPGAYYLDNIIDDTTGLRVKIWRDRVVIPPCPSVHIYSLSDPKVCQNQPLRAQIVASGVTPITLMIDGKSVVLGEAGKEDAIEEVEYFIEKTGQHGEIVTEVDSVVDALGTRPKSLPKLSSLAHIIEPARAKFIGSQRLAKVGDFVDVNVEVTGSSDDFPFTLELSGPGDQVVSTVLPNSGKHQLKFFNTGHYTLLSLNGAKCPGQAIPGSVEIFEPPAVDINAQFDVIEDKCAGPTGVRANVQLEGTGSFKVEYRTWKRGRVVSHNVAEIREHTGTVEFKPKDVGEYRYEIVAVEDQYRRKDVSGLSISQVIKELPGAQFGALSSTKLCGTNKLSAEVLIRGRGPFTLGYSVDDKSHFEVKTEGTADAAKVELNLELSAGVHHVRLDTLTDRNGCVTQLHGLRTPNIEVNPVIPHVAFSQPGSFKSAEPVNMGIGLEAKDLRYPSTVVYEYELDGKTSRYQQVLESADSQILATLPGKYRLIELNDGVCGGTVDLNQVVEISLYDKPQLVFTNDDQKSDGYCLNALNKRLAANLIGEAPFRVIHEVLDPQGKSHVKQHSISDSQLSVDLATDIAGEYSHFFWIMDSRYPEFRRPQYVKVKHQVWAPAEARFVKGQNKLKICENSGSKAVLPMTFSGQAPFIANMQIGNSPPFEVNVDQLKSFSFELGLEKLKRGVNKIKISGLTDKNGCSVNEPTGADIAALVDVLSPPSTPQLSQEDYCVGDLISFGAKDQKSKVNVEYHWNNKLRSVSLAPHQKFEKYASTPGDFKIVSVKDSQGCKIGTDVVAHVHELPSSQITETPHFSIYKGDQISLGFAFTGTAPFSFVYTRSVNGKIKERKEVNDVMENTYTILVDESGEYEIVELRDKFCRSRR